MQGIYSFEMQLLKIQIVSIQFFISITMSNLSAENLVKCILQKEKFKQTVQYLKEVELQNQSVYTFINQALYKTVVTNNYAPTSKLFALRFFKDLFLSAQFQVIDGLHQSILKHIVKACQFDKENQQKNKRGSNYFQQVQKRKKQADLQKISYSFVLFSTQIVYVMGKWHALDQNNEPTDYGSIYQKLKKMGVPFPSSDKELKFFKAEQKQVFMRNFKEWVQKLPQIQQESQEGDQKENQKSKKSVKSKNILPSSKQQQKEKDKSPTSIQILKPQDQNKTIGQSENKQEDKQENKTRAQLQSKIKQQKETLKEDQSIISRLTKQKDAVSNENHQIKMKLQQIQNRNKELSAKLNENKEVFQKKIQKQEFQRKKDIQDQQLKYSALQKLLTLVKTDFEKLQKQKNALKVKLELTERHKTKLEAQEAKHEDLNKKVELQKKQLQNKINEKIQGLKIQLQYSKQKIQSLQGQNQQLNKFKENYIKSNLNSQQQRQKIPSKDQSLEVKTMTLSSQPQIKTEIQKQPKTETQKQPKAEIQKQPKAEIPNQIRDFQTGTLVKGRAPISKSTKQDQLQRQIEQIVQFYTKEFLDLKSKLKNLASQNQVLNKRQKLTQKSISRLRKDLQQKDHQIQALKNDRTQAVQQNDSENNCKCARVKHLQAQSSVQPILESTVQLILAQTKKQLHRQNSMSDFLKSFSLPSQQMSGHTTNDHSAINIPNGSSIKVFDNLNQNKNIQELIPTTLDKKSFERPKSSVLGKTQKSLQKVKQRKNRHLGGNTFHFASNEFSQFGQKQNNKLSNSLSKNQPYQSSNTSLHTSSHKNLFLALNRTEISKVSTGLGNFNKKSSVLNLNRKQTNQQPTQENKKGKIETLIPYIQNYFSNNSAMSQKDSFIFRSLCLLPQFRQKQPIFADKLIQVKILDRSPQINYIFVLQVLNVGNFNLKVKALSCHDQFRILGDKTRYIHPNSKVEYQLETKIKDLNLRYPIVSFIVSEQQSSKSSYKNLTYNVPLPLTMLQFAQFDDEVPQFYKLNSAIKVYKSEPFYLDKNYFSLKDCFPGLKFTYKNRQKEVNCKQKNMRLYWQGCIRHKFIENIEAYCKIVQVQEQVCLQFAFRDYDQMNENFSKVMIQVLMFLLQ